MVLLNVLIVKKKEKGFIWCKWRVIQNLHRRHVAGVIMPLDRVLRKVTLSTLDAMCMDSLMRNDQCRTRTNE